MIEKNTFFASSNSAEGFQSYFDLIYNSKKMKKIYIVKGGPGTGKSHLIREVGKLFEDHYRTEWFLCSSDTESLDGIIIDGDIAIVDGTSPHSMEARYPGAVEVIVDSGKGISQNLSKYREKIFEINDKKSSLYKGAYSFLKSAGVVKKEYSKLITTDAHFEKLSSAIDRFFKQNVKKGNGYSENVRLIEGITPKGIYKTGSFEGIADKKCLLVNAEGFENIIFSAFLNKAKEYDIHTLISYDPLLPFSVNGLCFPNERLSVTIYDEKIHGDVDYDKYKIFNVERFINRDVYSLNRSKLRFSYKCMNSLVNESVKYLKEASETHKVLEAIYKEFMNYDYIGQYIKDISENIQSCL